MRFERVQTYFAHKAAAYLSKEWKTTVSLKGIYIKPFNYLVLRDLLVLDQQKDTLVYTSELSVKVTDFSTKKNFIKISEIKLNEGNFFIKSDQKGQLNFDFILKYFDTGKPKPKNAIPSKAFIIDLKKIVINNTHLRYKDLKSDTLINGINYSDIDAKNLQLTLHDIDINKHLFKAKITQFSFKEKSGFVLQNLQTEATIDSNQMILDQLHVKTPFSLIGNYLALKFKNFGDLGDFVNKVRLKAHIKSSEISSKDLAFFVAVPMIQKMNMNLKMDAEVTGLVKNLKIKQAKVIAGKATYIQGDFGLKGLPDINNTFMDFTIKTAGSNRKDLNEILGKTIGDKDLIPAMVNKFGDIQFNGTFQGYANDFIAFGDFKTKMGRASLDVNMKFNKKFNPTYSGTVKTYGFNIGQLIDDKTIGPLSSEVQIQGSGTNMNDLSVAIRGQVKSIYYNKYTYNNVLIDGTFRKKYFKGKLNVNDKNIKLNFDGGVNLQNTLPAFHFDAQVHHINLRELHFYKDTLSVSADFKINFSGTNLSNLAGNLLVRKIELTSPKEHYQVDSVYIGATGNGANRSLTIQSDMLEANVKGQFDLGTMLPYYQSLAKKYIPSLAIKTQKFKPQLFQATLLIKDFSPISKFFVKGLEIESGATIVGNFNSDKGEATLNGFLKNVKYQGIVINNIIIDQNTSDKAMQAVITSDKVQLNDSSAIKNVNLSYNLKNDSLSMNLKLTDELEVNKVDLNGLVEFSRDSIARLSILPSLLLVNNEEWKIEDKADIRFGNGSVFVKNLEVGNGEQRIFVNGAVSDDSKDKLGIRFEKFSLATFNPLLKAYGARLQGKLNGETSIFGITKTLKIHDNIAIDSLTFNDSFIGNLLDTSSYNHSEGKAFIYTKIDAFGEENLRATGSLNLKEKSIDIGIKLNSTEIALFEPFVHDFISKLKGNMSTDITVKGSFDHPAINGEIQFEEAQFKVNYLGTTYSISDQISIQNSVINFGKLDLLDAEGHLATVEGSVNMTNMKAVKMDIFVKAKNFLALNTTARENDLYYGKAYATSTPNQPIHIEGTPDDLSIVVNAKTEKGTIFNLPLNNASKVSDKDYIIYLSKDSTKNIRKANNFKGLKMAFNLQVDPDATVNIFTVLGNLSGQGKGNIAMNINSLGDFTMNGEYIIESGKFNLTASDLINKQFDIKRGGTIRWTGSPLEAQISNLNAVYEVRANLNDLYTAANRDIGTNSNNQRVQTEVNMLINGTLFKPNPKLSIDFPNRPGIKDDLLSYFSDENNVSLQAFSLIIRKNFSPNTNKGIGDQLASVGASAGTEYLFNQVTNAFNQLLNSTIFDINIRGLNDANAGLKLFKERLLLSGGVVNMQTNSAFSANFNKQNTALEAEASYLVRKDAGFIAKLGYKPPIQQDVITTNAPTRLNVLSPGVILNTQFDTFKELIHRYSKRMKKTSKEAAASDKVEKDATEKRNQMVAPNIAIKVEEFERKLNVKDSVN